MNEQIISIAERIKGMRISMDWTVEEAAEKIGVTLGEYLQYEAGEKDFSFTFLYNAAKCFGADISEIITGESPKLSFYTIVRKGEGLPIERREGFKYQNMAYLFKKKKAEPFVVTAPYDFELENKPVPLSHHEGQEFDFILKGRLKVVFEGHEEVLNEGDTIYYDSAHGHGMIAVGGEDCQFLAVVIK